jgi:putative ABC transport system permease protein
VPGVRAVEPIQHRFAYIGADLQDLFGVRPETIRRASALQDSYFSGGTADQLLHTLSIQPDSVLVSAETVKDYQLQIGDPLNLRLAAGPSHELRTIPFHYVGVVSEFPTAPKDSFFVANASYIADRTGSDAVGAYLIDTGGTGAMPVAQKVRALLGTAGTVTDISSTRRTIGSSLTAVDLTGLTKVELSFALVLAAAAGGLVFGLGLAERRRVFAIAAALGATRRQLRSMITSEALLLGTVGLAAGATVGAVLAGMLVTVLTGVFDPPPSVIPVPWPYLAWAVAVTSVFLVLVSWVASRRAGRAPVEALREL